MLCGDFNSPAGSPEHEALLRPGAMNEGPAFVHVWSQVHGAVPPAPTFGVHEQRYVPAPACYDIFFVWANIADRVADVVVDGATDASDHQPVLLKLT